MAPVFNPFSLHDKRVLVTGASSGLGQAIALTCARMGATVIGVGRDPTRLAQAAEVIDQLGPACQLRLRRCYFAQAAAFTAALGVGVVLPSHVAVPQVVRDHL